MSDTAILLVDDEAANLVALEAILEPLGQTLVRASNGKEALKATLKHDFAVILLDVQMPEMDGFETAELLRARRKTSDVPIIFLTAISKDQRFVARGYGVGAVDYLVKPYDPDVLRSKVAVFVELARKNAIILAQHEELRRLSERELSAFKERSEQRYAELADSMPHIVWTADAAGRVEYTNQRWDELGAKDLERWETPFDRIVHPDERTAFFARWTEGLATGEFWDAAFQLGNPSAGYRVHIVRVVPRRDREGAVVGWIGTATENDRRARASYALRMLAESSRKLGAGIVDDEGLRETLESALSVVGDVAVMEIEGRSGKRRIVAYRNGKDGALVSDPRFEVGLATVPYSGRPLVLKDVAAEVEASRELAQSGRSADAVHLLAELAVSGYLCFPLDVRGRVVGALVTARLAGGRYADDDVEMVEDLARRFAAAIDNAMLHEQGERRRVELEEANRGKDVFLATLSHELRTPLNAIVGWTDMMQGGRVAADELPRAIETVNRNALALSSLVGDLLDVSRIVTGTLKVDAKVISLASIVEAAIESARPSCSAKGIRLETALEAEPRVEGDAGRLKQVVNNLLSNAIKFTPADGTITVRLAVDGDRASILVKDSGEGIDPSFLPQVFERFRQEEKAKARGLGLGLAIVKHLVTEHGGTVTAESEGAGQGATFRVLLPVTEQALATTEEATKSDHPASQQPVLDGIHALVVEDDPDGNELITAILERYGARVTSVGTVADALAALEQEPPDILVSDIGLPDADGMTLIRTVRGREGIAGLPAIALTAYASRQDAAKAIAAGFDAHVAKPVQPALLGATIGRLTREKRDVKSPAA